MNIEFTRAFEKQIDKVTDVNSLSSVSNIKKLRGYKSAFRIRTGNYRIGIIFHKQTVYFAAFAHRKEIYKIFP